MTILAGPQGEAPGFDKRQKPSEEEIMDHSLLLFMGKANEAKGNNLGLANLNNVIRLLDNRSIL